MAILVINTVVHFYTVAHLTALTALKQMDPEFETVSMSLRQPVYRTFWRVTVPVCLPAILDTGMYLFVNAMTTVSGVVFLYGPQTELASVAVLNMDDAGRRRGGGGDGDDDLLHERGRPGAARGARAVARAADPGVAAAMSRRAPADGRGSVGVSTQRRGGGDMSTRRAFLVLAMGLVAGLPGRAWAAGLPGRAIEIVVPYAPGRRHGHHGAADREGPRGAEARARPLQRPIAATLLAVVAVGRLSPPVAPDVGLAAARRRRDRGVGREARVRLRALGWRSRAPIAGGAAP